MDHCMDKQEGYRNNEWPHQGRGRIPHHHFGDLTRPELHFTESPSTQGSSKGTKSARFLADTRVAHSVLTMLFGPLMSQCMGSKGLQDRLPSFPG